MTNVSNQKTADLASYPVLEIVDQTLVLKSTGDAILVFYNIARALVLSTHGQKSWTNSLCTHGRAP